MSIKEKFREIEGVLYDDPPMTQDDKAHIRVCLEWECKEVWDKYVSTSNRHFMRLGDDEWPSKIVSENEPFYFWQEDWNNDNIKDFQRELKYFQVGNDEVIYIFWMKEVSASTTWEVFCRNWINFLYEDEGCIVVCKNNKTSLVLSNGRAWAGQRIINQT